MIPLLDPDRKRMATAIIRSKVGEGGKEERSEKPKSDRSVAKSQAMSSFLSAVDRKDADGMASALGQFHDLHSARDDEDKPEPAAMPNPQSLQQTKREWS